MSYNANAVSTILVENSKIELVPRNIRELQLKQHQGNPDVTRRFIKSTLRRFFRSERLYVLARRVMLIGQFVSRRPDEPDLRAFTALRSMGGGLAIDIGANGGQSAIAFSFLLPKFQIISFEPNPALWAELDFMVRFIGPRFSYRKLGLASTRGSLTLFVPQIGDLPVTTRASLDRKAAEQHCRELELEVGDPLSIQELVVDVVTFDSLQIDPDAVKIDVEGYELQVLQGMVETLRRARPMLMLESNAESASCAALLEKLNYQIFYRLRETGALIGAPDKKARNWFAIPTERVAEIVRSISD